MLTIRKKLAEEASRSSGTVSGRGAGGDRGEGARRGSGVKRRVSFRTKLLTDGEWSREWSLLSIPLYHVHLELAHIGV